MYKSKSVSEVVVRLGTWSVAKTVITLVDRPSKGQTRGEDATADNRNDVMSNSTPRYVRTSQSVTPAGQWSRVADREVEAARYLAARRRR